MNNNIAVKFLHPGGETPKSYIKEGFCQWKNKPQFSKKQLHARKFIITDGDYLTDLDNEIAKGQIGFWGEWEANSLVKENKLFASLDTSKTNNYPKYFHTPLKPDKTPKSNNIHFENTDPCVIGDNFYYGLCQQQSKTAKFLKNMNIGDIIIFGSTFSPRTDKLFVLDTVFVILDKKAYHPKEAKEKLASIVPDWYFHLTLNLIPDNEEYILYIGANYQNQINGMFSFFPCIQPSAKPEGFIRPTIKSDILKINGHNQGAGKFKDINGKDVTAKQVWGEVVNSVIQEKLNLGLNARI